LKKQATLKPAVASWTSSALAYSPDGTLLAVATDKDVILWDVAARTERRRLDQREVRRLAFAPDGKALAAAGQFEIRLWDPATGHELHRRPGHDAEVWSITVSPDGKLLASASCNGNDPVVRLWDAVTGKPLSPLPVHGEWVRSCAFSADGKLLLSGCRDTLHLCSATTGQEVRRFVIKDVDGLPQKHEVLVCHLSPDGRRLAAVSTVWDDKLKRNRTQMSVWDARTGEPVARRPFRGGLSSRFTPDGEGVTVDGTDYLTIEDVTTGRELAIIPGNLGNPVAFSPGGDNPRAIGELVVAGIHKPADDPPPGDGAYEPVGLRVAEIFTGQEVFHVGGWIEFAAFAPGGRVLATADPDALRLWDALTGERLFERPWPGGLGHGPLRTPISSLVFLPTGRALATGMGDGTVLVWDLASAKWPTDGPGRDLSAKQLAGLWEDLGGDARRACPPVHALTSVPAQAVAFLKDHLRPVAAADPERVEKWLRDLDSDQFEVRETASRELSRLGEQAEPALRRALQGKPSDEVRRRAQSLLDGLRARPSAPVLRTLRAIRLLARLHTPEARQLLDKLAAGAPARETRAAREALEHPPAGR
jgi:WD40 repeat protein